MKKIQNYVNGKWTEGTGEGVPMFDAITGEVVALSDTQGLDFGEILHYGRTKGSEKLRKMTFQERGNMLKSLALYLMKKKAAFYELSYRTGATKVDSWIDIEGGFGNLFANASLRKLFPNQSYHVEGDAIDLSRGGRFMAHHIMVPKKGVAVHINAFNFPVWGMLEKCATNWMAGVPAVVKPATNTSFLTEAVVREIIASGILPEGALQLITGSARTILDTVESQDVVTFTGSATTGRLLKSHKRIIDESVPFNMEADSLNASVLGEDAIPGTPEFDLFIKEVRNEMTVKCGQKCTAIRRIIVPQNLVEDVQIALGKALSKVTIGDPRLKEVRMGALVSKDQVTEVRERVQELSKTASIVYGDLDKIETIGADAKKGAFLSPILLREDHPFTNLAVHETEAFGPVSTIMPYKNLDEAITLAQMGKGSLVSSIATYDNKVAKDYVVNAASHHGRILVINRDMAKESTGHGSPLPNLVHGGPGRAGGGEEMGGMRGIKHYLQRTAIQGSPTTLTEITGIYQQNAEYKEAEQHPFKYHWEDIKAGMSLKTHNRTLTDSDIINFANLTWDHFYAHTDTTSLDGSIFEKRTAHGYFIIAAAAGLFVYPNKGPVAANYGLEECRFLRPLYHNDTIYVRLTCKQKIDRDVASAEHPSGIVKWYVEVFDALTDEMVAFATILTMVEKKQEVFVEMTEDKIKECLSKLKEDFKPKWGILTPQHLLEHLEEGYRLASGEIKVTECVTPEKIVEKVHNSLYNYEKFPKGTSFPTYKKEELEDLKHPDFETAKAKFFEAREAYVAFYKENPDAVLTNMVFGDLNRYEWYLLERKHLNHHFEQFGLI
ncbi:oxepin-CoA hydrolase/3-oxo-5,6-dehydrosuberyl-CoA semialdehyde dehydrogenase [Winogradskyella epiphytica]|uniref:Oxepin-CoA hydrolase/3-oxo-5,6-dehydrosuberyl-CoA semialdehyde dehydrogenase n=1 Tax=Winogradskyella epiphytica TaxID=262005 RepID=A0A2V4X6E9_9FLAO|nr:phenylacetic acid degradation bifunctional protein PaaZ [Winogradskyella epiphytica]PYE80749.1 oxepin-CoA hydrolase/3-oxo-5,6-dehydrosuberyl-CoA semialdehyde dehydrogenase [Winogradskyella epiphytica]GGW68172.1 bifunctional aldehyde dehydrogenase/enoyl-CoA hydratase [Winogradskyella epiphytica]